MRQESATKIQSPLFTDVILKVEDNVMSGKKERITKDFLYHLKLLKSCYIVHLFNFVKEFLAS